MNLLKKTILITILFLTMITILVQGHNKNLSSTETSNVNLPLKVSVLFNNYNIDFLRLLTEDMKKVEQENPGTVQYTFYDGKGSQDIQDNQLNDILAEKNVDLIMIDMVDVTHSKYVVDRIKELNIPVIFSFNGDIEAVNSYSKSFLAQLNPMEGGILQGNIIVEAWTKNKINIDKNQNNVLEYIMLLGSPNNIISIDRSKYSVSTIKSNNIKTQELGEVFCYWSQDQAKEAVSQFLLRFGNEIEVIISVQDGMAIGAVKALQEYGYNLGNNNKKVIVVGCDGVPAALDLVNNGAMTGTVIQDSYEIANDFYTFSMNLMDNKNVIDGTNCTVDSSGQLITIPYKGVAINLN